MAYVSGSSVAGFLGRGDDEEFVSLANIHAQVVAKFVRGYTRGNGFDPDHWAAEDLEAVIITATARLIANPTMTVRESAGEYSVVHPQLDGFTLPELAVLNRYRRRTA